MLSAELEALIKRVRGVRIAWVDGAEPHWLLMAGGTQTYVEVRGPDLAAGLIQLEEKYHQSLDAHISRIERNIRLANARRRAEKEAERRRGVPKVDLSEVFNDLDL